MTMQDEHNVVRRGVYFIGKKVFILTVAGALLAQPLWSSASVFAADDSTKLSASTGIQVTKNIVKVKEDMITSGAKMVTYKWSGTRSKKSVTAQVNVIEMDLSNPYVKMDVMTGQGNQFTTLQSVGGMAKETGAVAGVNGDYFATGSEGAPLGPQITDGTLMSTPSLLQGMYAFAVTGDREPIIDQFTFEGKVTAPDGAFFPLAGMNKTAYKTEPDNSYSHVNAMYVYTSAWKQLSRPSDSSTTPTEVLIQNGVVMQISEKAPLNMAVPTDGYILRTHGIAADFVRDHLQIGEKIDVQYALKSTTTQQSVDPSGFQMMIGGHTLLVENGKASTFSRNTNSISGSSARARTAVGYSKDKKTAYIITVAKNDSSTGMTLKELQNFMTDISVWKAVNLDGGGSTTLVSRPLGETSAQLTYNTEYGKNQRRVVNGLGVYTTAPTGTLKGLMVSGNEVLFVGQDVNYSLKGYDTYYNPFDVSSVAVNWSAKTPLVKWNGQSFTAMKPGKTMIVATSQDAKTSMDVEVIGGGQIDSMSIGNPNGVLEAGAQITLPVSVKLTDGRSASVPAESVKWEFQGFKGSVQGNTLTVQEVQPNTVIGYAIARYDGFSSMMTLTASKEQLWEDFENVKYPFQFAGLTQETTGTVAVQKGIAGREQSNVLVMNYDMTLGTGKKYANAVLNGSDGVTVDGAPSMMSIDVMGDGSLNWLRAEFNDADNKKVYVDIAKMVDWTDWKTFNIDLTSYKMKYPVRLNKLYLVNVEEGQDERAATGAIAFDNIKFKTPVSTGQLALPKPKVQLKVDSKVATVNGKNKKIQDAPISKNGVVYVPVKVVLDEFGGSWAWDAKLKKLMVLRGTTMMELWTNSKDYIVNGKRTAAEAPPIVQNGRVYVPLRLVSDQLGLKMDWEPKNKSITLQ